MKAKEFNGKLPKNVKKKLDREARAQTAKLRHQEPQRVPSKKRKIYLKMRNATQDRPLYLQIEGYEKDFTDPSPDPAEALMRKEEEENGN